MGTYVTDANAPELADGSNITATGTGSWTYVGSPGHVAFRAETGSVTGTSVTCDVEVEIADDSSGTNARSVGVFQRLTEADDNVDRFLQAYVDESYARVSYTVAGTSPVIPLTVTAVQPHLLRDGDTSA